MAFFFIGCVSEELTSARLYIQQKNWVKAEEFLLKAMEVEPENPEVYYSLGEHIYAKKKDWGNMNKMFDMALEIDSNRIILQERTVQEYVEQARYEHWRKEYNKGVNTFQKYQKKLEVVRAELLQLKLEAAKTPEENEELYNRLKTEQNKLKEKEKSLKKYVRRSIKNFEIAVQIYPEKIENYLNLSTCYYENGDSEKSINAAKKGADINPENFMVNLTAGQKLNNNEDKRGALPYLKKAVELDSQSSVAIQLLAQIYYDLGQQKEAVETYKIAIEKESDKKVKADLYFNLGVIYNQMGSFDDAELAFDEAYYLNDQDFEAVMGMARAFEGLGDKYKDGTDGVEKDLSKAARWYKKAEKKIKDAKSIDIENEHEYSKQLELIRYKRNYVEGLQ